MRVSIVLGLLAVSSGCVGEAAAFEEELAVYDFSATVAPMVPVVAGHQVQMNLEVISFSSVIVTADVWLEVRRPDASLAVARSFDGVVFHPEESWVLLSSFLPNASDRELTVDVVVRRHDTGEELWRMPSSTPLSIP